MREEIDIQTDCFFLSKHMLLLVSALDCFGDYARYSAYIIITTFPHSLIISYASVPLPRFDLLVDRN